MLDFCHFLSLAHFLPGSKRSTPQKGTLSESFSSVFGEAIHARICSLLRLMSGQKFEYEPSLTCERNKLGKAPKGEL